MCSLDRKNIQYFLVSFTTWFLLMQITMSFHSFYNDPLIFNETRGQNL